MASRPSGLLVSMALVATLGLSGCVQEPTVAAAEAFVLDFRIVDLGRDRDARTAEPGHHCGDVAKDGDTLTVWLWPDEERPDGPWLAVFPSLPDDWHSGLGSEPYKTTFPATIHPRVSDDDTELADLEWESDGANGTLRVDGDAVSLPHSWTVTGADGTWRAEATLTAWDGTLRHDRYTGLCD